MTYTKFLKWMNINKHTFRVTRKGTIRSYDDLCPLQVWTRCKIGYEYEARERGMPMETIDRIIWASDYSDAYDPVKAIGQNNRNLGKDRKAMLRAIEVDTAATAWYD